MIHRKEKERERELMRKVLEWSIEKHWRRDDSVKYMAYKCKRIKMMFREYDSGKRILSFKILRTEDSRKRNFSELSLLS